MKIQNRTHWNTKQIRAIVQRCAEMELEPAQRKTLTVVVSYRRRGGGSSGCAYIKGRWAKIRVSSDIFDSRDFAFVACHEFAHVRGMDHLAMPLYYRRMSSGGHGAKHERYEWAASMVVERKQAPAKPSSGEKLSVKHANAIARLVQATTRAKRAVTILKKWQRKVRYYEGKMAAMTTKGQA